MILLQPKQCWKASDTFKSDLWPINRSKNSQGIFLVQISGETAPYTHSLSFLAKRSDLYQYFSEEQDFIDLLEPMNIEARYPINKKKLLDGFNRRKMCLNSE